MKIPARLALTLISLFTAGLTGCTSMSSIMPKQGPTMEQVYDGMKKSHAVYDSDAANSSDANEAGMASVRKSVSRAVPTPTTLSENVPARNTWQSFHKVPNPTLNLYVYPHLAGNDELPVPGYTTAFNAYEKDHYSLLND
jgi:conjugative transfer region lipoprotein (TIGR03751 family)